MTAYNNSPFAPTPVLMVGGRTQFLYGGFDDRTSPTKIQVSSVAIASNVATVVGTIVSGNIPTVGSPVYVQGTASDSGAANVNNVALASVTANQTTGLITITYAATGSNQSTTADAGFALVPLPITYDTLANGSSKQAASAENDPSTSDERAYFAQVFFGTIPTACTVTLQGSLVDQDSAYQNLGTVATVAAGAVTLSSAVYSNMNLKFLRFNVSALSGTGTIAAAVMG